MISLIYNKKQIFSVFILFFLIFTMLEYVYSAQITDHRKTQNRSKQNQKSKSSDNYETFIAIDFDDVDILQFIKFISDLTGINFIIDRRVKGKVSIISPTKISINEAFKVFESVLEVHGYALVEAGEVTKIIPATDARTKNIETRLMEEASSPEDKVITQIIHLNYADANEVKKLFSPLISKSSVILSYPQTNMLIVTDVLSNIQRLLHILTVIDIEGVGSQISMVPIEFAVAADIVKTLNAVFTKGKKRRGGSADEPVKVVAEDRTNTIIILASEDDSVKIKKLIEYFDKEVPRGEGKIRVYYLEHAKAEDIVKVLKNIPSKSSKTEKGKAPVISKDVNVASDKATNSLIITASKDDYKVLEDVIKLLDIPRAMVYIECLIMEVSSIRSLDFSLNWRVGDEYNMGGNSSSKGAAFLSSGTAPLGLNASSLSSFGASTLGVLGDTITYQGIAIPTIAALINYIKNDSDINILSTPQILTTDNEEATIEIGEQVPYEKETTLESGTINRTADYKKVGLSLKVTPQINKNGFVRLELEQKQSDYSMVSVGSISAPSTMERSAKTTVVIKNEQTIVISGMISENNNKTSSKIPCLSAIPLIGNLFHSSKSNSLEKKNLFIFLTPHIIENPERSEKFFKEKVESIKKGMKVDEGAEIKLYKKYKE